MIEIKGKLRRWGRSFGVIIPVDKVKEADLFEGSSVDVIITKEENPLKKHFNSFKFKKSTEQLLKEVDREGWDE